MVDGFWPWRMMAWESRRNSKNGSLSVFIGWTARGNPKMAVEQGSDLSIVKNLTRALDGTVRVISSPGEGATFEVWLPKTDAVNQPFTKDSSSRWLPLGCTFRA